MKLELTGINLSDLAVEYYKLNGKRIERQQALKNFGGIKEHTIDLDLVEEAMMNLQLRQRHEMRQAKKAQKKLVDNIKKERKALLE